MLEVSLPKHFYYAKFRYFFKVMLTKHASNESNLPCQNALKLTYGHVKSQKFFRGLYPRTPAYRGGKGRAGYRREGEGRVEEGGKRRWRTSRKGREGV